MNLTVRSLKPYIFIRFYDHTLLLTYLYSRLIDTLIYYF